MRLRFNEISFAVKEFVRLTGMARKSTADRFGTNPYGVLLELKIPNLTSFFTGSSCGPFVSHIGIFQCIFRATGSSKSDAKRSASYLALAFLRDHRRRCSSDHRSLLDVLEDARDTRRRQLYIGKPPSSKRTSEQYATLKLQSIDPEVEFRSVCNNASGFFVSVTFRRTPYAGRGATVENANEDASQTALSMNHLWTAQDELIKHQSDKAGANVL